MMQRAEDEADSEGVTAQVMAVGGGLGLLRHPGCGLTAGNLGSWVLGLCSQGSGGAGALINLPDGKRGILFCFLSEIRHKIVSFISPINNY